MEKIIYDGRIHPKEYDRELVYSYIASPEKQKYLEFSSYYNEITFLQYFQIYFAQIGDAEKTAAFEKRIFEILGNSPSTVKAAANIAIKRITIDCDLHKVFKQTKPEVIVGFFFQELSKLLYDEFCIFDFRSNTSKFLAESHIKYEDFLYDVILETAKKIKRKKYDCSEEESIYGIEIPLTSDDLVNLQNVPKNLNEAVDGIMSALSKKDKNFKNSGLDFDTNIARNLSIDILTANTFGAFSHYMFYGWYLDRKDSPLRVWFRENKKMDEPFYICYYILRTTISTILLKHYI